MNALGHKIETLLTFALPEECSPARLLAVNVIRQAVADVATQLAQRGRLVETWAAQRDAADARDFLLRRLWDVDCTWSQLYIPDLLTPGMRATLVAYCHGVPMREPGRRRQPTPVEIAEELEPV